MSASEMQSLVMYFTLLVDGLVDFQDEGWLFYLTLYDIVYFCFKRTLTNTEIMYLKLLIQEHHNLLKKLFKGKLKPKCHFLIHYPNIIKSVGSVQLLSSMRYESFHNIGKTNAHIVASRVNIIKTLALRFQLRFRYRLHFKIDLSDKVTFGKSSFVDIDSFPTELPEKTSKQVCVVDWLRFN